MIHIKDINSFSCSGPRPNQEDYTIAPGDTSSRIFVLCDGMGGHGHGEVASKTIADSVYGYLTELNPTEYTEENLQDAVDFALKELIAADIYDDEKAMGTTIVVIAVNRMNILVGHIGDSRCYQFSEDGIKKFRSKDHSKVQEAVDAEILTEEEAWCSPQKNILTRCITSKQLSVKIDVDNLQIEDNDCIMLCSDGVTDALKDPQIQSIIVGRSLRDAANIIKTECEISSRDNFSLILISFSQDENSSGRITRFDNINTADKYNDNSDLDVKSCLHCGRELAGNANFCPSCGLSCSQSGIQREYKSHYPVKEVSFFRRMQNINPLWLIAGGAIIGSVITGVIISSVGSSDVHGQNIITTPLKDENVVSELELSSFVSEICSVDTVNAPNDTAISKHILQEKFQSFIGEIHKNVE